MNTENPISKSKCRACLADRSTFFLEKHGHVYRRCENCGLVFADISEEELLKINRSVYDDTFGGELPSPDSEFSKKKLRRHHFILKKLAPHKTDGKILEVGCGNGAFLETARNEGWDPVGIEIAEEAAAAAKSRDLEIHTTLLDECQFEDKKFDIVLMNEVLEHVWDPRSLLDEIFRILKPGGALFLRTRNPDSWTADFCGVHWHHYSVQEQGHVSFFPPKAFRTVLGDIGFTQINVRTWGSAFDDRFPKKKKLTRKAAKYFGKLIGPLETKLEKGQRIEVLAVR